MLRCFEALRVENCKRLNVLVGDNGGGKTAFLEAIFLALGTSAEVATRFRGYRGVDPSFNAAPPRIEEAMWGGIFRNHNFAKPVVIELDGDGLDNRTLIITRGGAGTELPLQADDADGGASGPFTFTWKDASGTLHPTVPAVLAGGPPFQSTGEDLQDFYYFAANQTYGSIESAGRFSALSKAKRAEDFVNVFAEEYPWIENINVEVEAGAPLLYATLKYAAEKQSLPEVSGGINRITAIMVTIASRRRSILLIDEIENGIYYVHHPAIWRGILKFARQFEAQLFVSTHSAECVQGLLKAADDKVDDIALLRFERDESGPVLYQFSGDTLRSGLELGAEVRGIVER